MSPSRPRGVDGRGAGDGPRYEAVPLPGMPTPPRASTARVVARSSRTPAPARPTLTSAGQPLPQMAPQHADATALRSAVVAFVVGRDVAAGPGRPDVRSMLVDAYGPSPRDPDRPDLAVAAADLGMSTRQLQRWVRGETTPARSNQRLQKLIRRARSATTSRTGRRRALGRRPAQPPAGRVRLRVGGVQGVLSSNDDQYRDRVTETELSAHEYAEMQRVWVEHGHRGVVDFLHAHFDRTYVTNWHFESIDSLTWSDPRGR